MLYRNRPASDNSGHESYFDWLPSHRKNDAGPAARRAFGLDRVDADVEIERRAGKSIAKMFAEDGEPAFRDLEATVIAELCGRDRLVLATGGGAPLRTESRAAMLAAGHVIWLTANADTILTRMLGDATTADRRPSLTSLPPREEIVTVLERREPIYRETGHLIVDTENRSFEALVAKIIGLTKPGPIN